MQIRIRVYGRSRLTDRGAVPLVSSGPRILAGAELGTSTRSLTMPATYTTIRRTSDIW